VICGAEIVEPGEFERGRFYQEWVRPQGFGDAANVVIGRSTRSCSILSIIRDGRPGPVDEEMRRRIALLAPHIRRAVLIGRSIELRTVKVDSFADVLDGIDAGVFLVDARSRLLHANVAGRRMLSDGGILTASQGRLTARSRSAGASIEKAVAAALSTTAATDPPSSVTLTAADGSCYVAHILPLSPQAQPRMPATRARAAVFVQPASRPLSSPAQAVASAFALTPSELRVLLAVVEVGGLPAVAESLGIAEATAKTHLARLFRKTGTSRQADLVKLLAGFASPLLN
jgi:DNA-binding CsgD family transcriptional regulator